MEDELLYTVLNAQRREGGFEPAAAILELVHLSAKEFETIALRIRTEEKTDTNVLLATAIALYGLRSRFADKYREWETVVSKSEAWLNDEIRRVKPAIDGISMEDWLIQRLTVPAI